MISPVMVKTFRKESAEEREASVGQPGGGMTPSNAWVYSSCTTQNTDKEEKKRNIGQKVY